MSSLAAEKQKATSRRLQSRHRRGTRSLRLLTLSRLGAAQDDVFPCRREAKSDFSAAAVQTPSRHSIPATPNIVAARRRPRRCLPLPPRSKKRLLGGCSPDTVAALDPCD